MLEQVVCIGFEVCGGERKDFVNIADEINLICYFDQTVV